MKKFLFIILIIVSLAGAGLSGPLLLMDSYDAKSYSLAGSTVAGSGDVDMLPINPAALANLRGISGSLFYLPWFEDMSYFSMAGGYALSIKGKYLGTVGLNLSLFSVKPFPNYSSTGSKLPDLDASDMLLIAGYSYPLIESIDLGFSLKYFNSRLGDNSAGAAALDVGALTHFSVLDVQQKTIENNFSVALSIQNIGLPQKYMTENSMLPYKFRFGISYLFNRQGIMDSTLLLDMNKTKDQDLKSGLGLEISLINMFKLRLGYQIVGRTALAFTSGAGINYKVKNYYLSFDYALVPLQDFGVHHIFSLKVKFDNDKLRKQKIKIDEEPYDKNREEQKFNDKTAKGYIDLSGEYLDQHKFNEAIKLLEQYQQQNPQDAAIEAGLTRIRSILSDTEPPKITLNDFGITNSLTIRTQYYNFGGVVSDNIELKVVKINGEIQPLVEKNRIALNKIISLMSGENIFRIYAEDMKGNVAEKEVKALGEFKPVEMEMQIEVETNQAPQTNR